LLSFSFDAGSKDFLMFNKSKKGQKNELFYYLSSDKKWQQYSQFYPISLHRDDMFWVGWVFNREQMLRGLVFFSNFQIRLACKITNPYIIA
jgi:hypothetical protein